MMAAKRRRHNRPLPAVRHASESSTKRSGVIFLEQQTADKRILTDGVILDVDGTLWDSQGILSRVWTLTFSQEPGLSQEVTPDLISAQLGKPLLDIARAFLPGADDAQCEAFLQKVYANEDRMLHEDPPDPYPGTEDMLRALTPHIPVFIVSNCQAGYIETFMEVTGLGGYIADHLCPGDTNLLKADNIRLIAERHHLRNGVYVGDIYADYTAAREAGLAFIHAAYGYGEVPCPDAVIHSIAELPDVLQT